jgi:hypothetical protein
MINPGLFHDAVGHVPDPYLPLYRDISPGDGAVPYIMIPLAVPHEITAVVP